MKKIIYLLLIILPSFAFWSCDDKEDLVFEHEIPQFEIVQGKILIEVVVPLETSPNEEIYIIGDFNGGNAAAGKSEWKLQKSENVNLRWGIYLDPATFINGKSLADGYRFVSLTQGKEVTLQGEEVIRNENASVGNRTEEKITRWEAYFVSSNDWPIVPANKIMLRLTVPETTPNKSTIALYGNVNGWNGEDKAWSATQLNATRYYFILDPASFAEGTSLAEEFKVAVIKTGRDWWYHQANLDGSDNDGPGLSVIDTSLGNAYDIEIVNWRNVDEINDVIGEPEKNMIKFRQVSGNWEEFAVYAWGASEYYGGWPGLKLEADAEGWYSFEVPMETELNLIINNNNGGNQFDFISGDNIIGACYEFETQDGNNTSSFTEVDCPEVQSGGITIRWKYVGSDWTAFGIYAWGGTPTDQTFGAWPGTMAEPDSEGWCEVVVPAGQTVGNVIFNNGNGGDGNQFDVNMEITEDICFEITSNSFTVVDCD